MHIIDIAIRNKIAVNTNKTEYVCGNDDFIVRFDFDAEWDDFVHKTARFISNGAYVDVVFSGNGCAVPVHSGTNTIMCGVYAGDLRTTTPALIGARKSILCGSPAPAEPTPDVYAQMVALFNAGLDEGRVNANRAEDAKTAAEEAQRKAESAQSASETNAKDAKASSEAAASSVLNARNHTESALLFRNSAESYASSAVQSAKNAEASAKNAKSSAEDAEAYANQARESAMKFSGVKTVNGQKPDANGNVQIKVDGSGVTSWNDLTDKPFGETTMHGNTLTWDGNIEGLVSVGALRKVSDVVPTVADLANGFTFTCADITNEDSDIEEWNDGALFLGGGEIMIIPASAVGVDVGDGRIFAESGLYFLDGVSSFTIYGYTGFVTKTVKQMDAKYLPNVSDLSADWIADLKTALGIG